MSEENKKYLKEKKIVNCQQIANVNKTQGLDKDLKSCNVLCSNLK